MDALPIDPLLDRIAAAASAGAVVVEAPTGAGKTTRIPPHLQSQGQIWVIEPRRVAARAAARRMASERGWTLGQEVGWHVRFDKRCTDRSKIVVMTGGILLRRLVADPFLDGVGAVVFDEVHERALDLDLGLALVRELREERGDLGLIAMSATLDGERLAAWLGAPRITSEGRAFPVELRYRNRPDDRRIEDQVADGVRELFGDIDGDLLAFLPGVREIHRTAERLADLPADVVPLYGDLPPDKQDAALGVGPRRRIVLATNVAESSVTVPGVRGVVDSGLVRRPFFDPSTGFDRLSTVRISRASADQRAGRAGRTAPGVALRLWTERAHRDLAPFDPPEIRRSSLAGPVLQLLDQGIDPRSFGWFEPPRPEALDEALTLLADLGAVDGIRLTRVGRELLRIPLHPRLARLVHAAGELGQGEMGAMAAAWLSERDPLGPWSPGATSSSDLLDRVEALAKGRGHPAGRRNLMRVAGQLARSAPRAREQLGSVEGLGRAVLAAWPDRVALRREPGSPRARMVGGEGVALGPESAVRDADLFVAIDLGHRRDGDRRVRVASAVERDWLELVSDQQLEWDAEREAVRAFDVVRYRDLVLESHPTRPDRERASEVLAAAALEALDRVQPDTERWISIRDRILSLHHWFPDEWPDLDAAFYTQIAGRLCEGRKSFAQLRKADWIGPVRDHLGWKLWSELDQLAPERVEVPSGSNIRLRYTPGDPPVLAVRMQELFGARETPTVGRGRVRVRLELLAPNHRPQQITDDLAGFWERTWPEVRKQLRGRYPKHPWPEDPLSAQPTRRTKRK